jgi:hypothetical protein
MTTSRQVGKCLIPCTEGQTSHELIKINQSVSFDVKLTEQAI